jgi:hypothetical protein
VDETYIHICNIVQIKDVRGSPKDTSSSHMLDVNAVAFRLLW